MGDTFPSGPTPVFPPNRWKCPTDKGGCGKEHSKPHFPYPGQVDESMKAGEIGRIRFNRIGKDEKIDDQMKVVEKYVGKEGDLYDENGKPNPLFCCHCGFTLDGVLITKLDAQGNPPPLPIVKKKRTLKEKLIGGA